MAPHTSVYYSLVYYSLSESSCFMYFFFLLNEEPRLPRSIIAHLQLCWAPVSSITHKPTPQWGEAQEGWILMHLHKSERDELQEMVLAPVLSDVCWEPLF